MTGRDKQACRETDRARQADRQTDRQTGRQDNKVACLKKLGMPRWGPKILVLILLKTGERSEPRFFYLRHLAVHYVLHIETLPMTCQDMAQA